MTTPPPVASDPQDELELCFALTRNPRFDVAAPLVWEAWHTEKEGGGHFNIKVTWRTDDPAKDLQRAEWLQSSAPWERLFQRYPELEKIYRTSFWGVDAESPEIMEKMDRLNQHLAYRTVLLETDLPGSKEISIADVLLWGVIRANHISRGMAFNDPSRAHLRRWLKFMDAHPALEITRRAHRKASNIAENEARRKRSSGGGLDAILPVAEEGKVVVRFECSTRSFMHVGQLKDVFVNQYYADKYRGRFVLRFDDLNTLDERNEFVNHTRADLHKLGVDVDKVVRATDHLDIMAEKARGLIKLGLAYMDEAPQLPHLTFPPSFRREVCYEANAQRFEEMLTGSEVGRRWVLRARIDSESKSPSMCDPIIFACFAPSGKASGITFTAFPTHDFASPILDHMDGVTHVLRSRDNVDKQEQYEWFVDRLGLRQMVLCHLPRLDPEHNLTSINEVQNLASQGTVSGWDDPRVASVRGLLARGMAPTVLKKHILDKSQTIEDAVLGWDDMWYANKRAIDLNVPRYYAVAETSTHVIAKLEGVNEVQMDCKPLNKMNPKLGTKLIVITVEIRIEQADAASLVEGEEITLMSFNNAFVSSLEKSTSPQGGTIVTGLTLTLNPAGLPKSTSKKLHWLPVVKPDVRVEPAVTPVVLVKYPHPNNVTIPEQRTCAIADREVCMMKPGDVVQFERKGYYVCKGNAREGGLEFTSIPQGRNTRRRRSTGPSSPRACTI